MILWDFMSIMTPLPSWKIKLKDSVTAADPLWPASLVRSLQYCSYRRCSFPSFNLRVVGLWVIWLNNRNNSPMFLLLRQVLVLGRRTGFFGGLASSFVWLTVIILPVLALILSLHLRLCRSWRDGFVQYSKPFRLLQFIFPFCCAAVFALALLVAIGSVRRLSSYLFNQNGVCNYLDNDNDGGNIDANGGCYDVSGAPRPGTWIFLIQSFASEIYAFLTLQSIRNVGLSQMGNPLNSDLTHRRWGIFA